MQGDYTSYEVAEKSTQYAYLVKSLPFTYRTYDGEMPLHGRNKTVIYSASRSGINNDCGKTDSVKLGIKPLLVRK